MFRGCFCSPLVYQRTRGTFIMENLNPKVVQIFDDSGRASLYKKVSARVPEFLEKYGPDKGYRVLSLSIDYLETTPARKALLLELVKTASDSIVLTNELNSSKIVFTCQLLNKEGNIVAVASAVKKINFQKDYESGETAAFQRLMAKLGFGGEIFDEDEANDMISQELNFTNAEPEQAAKTVVEAIESKTTVAKAVNKRGNEKVVQVTSSNAEPKGNVEPVIEKSNTAQTTIQKSDPNVSDIVVKPESQVRVASSTKSVDKETLQPGLLRQLNQLSQVKQVGLPVVTTAAELKKEIARLHKLPLPTPTS